MTGILILLILLLNLFFVTNLNTLAASIALPFHELCLQFSPRGPWQSLYSALVCGSNLESGRFNDALRSTSLLHVAIVSGSHLILLENILRFLLPRNLSSFKFIFFFLFIFSLLTGWQPPAVRALFTLILDRYKTAKKLNWKGPQTTLFAGLLTWLCFPHWFFSYSFLLSWGASLALCLVPNSQNLSIQSQWKIHLFVYVLLLPLLAPFGGAHPFSILCNWIIGPLFSLLFFPLSLTAFLIPLITPLTDFIWQLAVSLITWLGQYIPSPELELKTPIVILWIYLFALQLVFHFYEVIRRRRLCFTNTFS